MLIYVRVYTKLADKVELLAAVRCGFPLETRMPQNISTGFSCIWHIHPVTVADIGAIQPCKGTWEKLIKWLQLNWLSVYFLFWSIIFVSQHTGLQKSMTTMRCNLGIVKQQSDRLCCRQGEWGVKTLSFSVWENRDTFVNQATWQEAYWQLQMNQTYLSLHTCCWRKISKSNVPVNKHISYHYNGHVSCLLR